MGFAPTWLRQVSPLLHKTTLTTVLMVICKKKCQNHKTIIVVDIKCIVFFCHLAKGSPFVLVIMSVYPTESQGRVQDFSFFNIFNSSRYCRNQSQYLFVFARPNNKVMTAALTRIATKKLYSFASVAEPNS